MSIVAWSSVTQLETPISSPIKALGLVKLKPLAATVYSFILSAAGSILPAGFIPLM